MKHKDTAEILKKRDSLSRSPWVGGYGHYAVVDKKRSHWETVCHCGRPDGEFVAAFRDAVQRLANRTQQTS